MNDVDSYRSSHLHKGQDYHEMSSLMPHTSMMWSLEKGVLQRVINKYLSVKSSTHLDFACGTGRIICFFRDAVKKSTGVDVSASMLEVTRSNFVDAEIHEADITSDDVLGNRIFTIITAFRFFPNAESALRKDVITTLVRHMDSESILVFNNHMNTTSLTRKFMRLFGKGTGHTMATQEVKDLIDDAGLLIVEVYPLGILPMNDKFILRPIFLFQSLERLLSKLPFIDKYAQDLIYICKLR